mgnify:CR=1 FL=1
MVFRQLLVAAVCYSAADLLDARCQVGCLHAGYERGFHRENACWCVDRRDLRQTTGEKRLLVPGRTRGYSARVIPHTPRESDPVAQ